MIVNIQNTQCQELVITYQLNACIRIFKYNLLTATKMEYFHSEIKKLSSNYVVESSLYLKDSSNK